MLIVLSLESYAQSSLCESYPTQFGYEYLSDLSINGASKTVASDFNSGAGNAGYYDYTASNLTTMTAGQTYPVSFTVKTNGGFQEYVKVWFDFNGNGILSDAGEIVFDQNQTVSGTATYTGTIAVPATAYNGDVYIRVLMVYNNAPALCGTYQFGNTVDLKATIIGGLTPRRLTLSTSGTGSVISLPAGINTGSGQNSAVFADGTSVMLAAVPNAPQLFLGWSGDASGTTNPLIVTMDAAKDITALFGTACSNPSSGGTIASAQSICSGSSPSAISSSALPSGHTGTLEYKWQSSTTSSSAGFGDIASSNSASYSPGNLSATTWYKRLSRVDCKTDWVGAVESNVVQIDVTMGTPTLSYSVSGTQSFELNSAISNLVINNSGGVVLDGNYSVSPALPAGLVLEANGTISGTPTVVKASTVYTVTGTNVCGANTATLTISTGTSPSISSFSDINRMYYDASFNLVAPASTSSGAFTYTSSNTAVATVNGTTVTILSAGTTVLTANQAPDASYNSGSITATLTISSVSVVTKHGQNTTTNTAYVNGNGAVGGSNSLNIYGELVATKSRDGLSALTSGTSAKQIKTDFPSATDGVYWIDVPGYGPKQTYCLMDNAYDGGGWMLALKATTGTTFNYDANYWTVANTLNETDLTRNNGDAKYDIMNGFLAKDMMALWPDILNIGSESGSIDGLSQWSWLQNDFHSSGAKTTLISKFNGGQVAYYTSTNGSMTFSGYHATKFSNQQLFTFYGVNYTVLSNAKVRWGFAWNNEADQSSNDVSGGIGMDSTYGNYSAGDKINCCQINAGINRWARVEIFIG